MKRIFICLINTLLIALVCFLLFKDCQKERQRQTAMDDLLKSANANLKRPSQTPLRVTDTRVVAGKVKYHEMQSNGDLYLEIVSKYATVSCYLTSRSEISTVLPRIEQNPKSLNEWLKLHKGENCCGSVGFKDGVATNAVFVIDDE